MKAEFILGSCVTGVVKHTALTCQLQTDIHCTPAEGARLVSYTTYFIHTASSTQDWKAGSNITSITLDTISTGNISIWSLTPNSLKPSNCMAFLFNISNWKQNWFSQTDHMPPSITNSLDNLPDDPRFSAQSNQKFKDEQGQLDNHWREAGLAYASCEFVSNWITLSTVCWYRSITCYIPWSSSLHYKQQ